MPTSRLRAATAVAVLWTDGPVPGAPAQLVYPADTPKDVRARFDQLRRREDRAACVDALSARDDTAPYLRAELLVAFERAVAGDLSGRDRP